MSSLRLTAATAPLIAKTNVPPKSRIGTKLSIVAITAPATPVDAYEHQLAPSQASAPTTSASTPVSRVGCRTGANCGL